MIALEIMVGQQTEVKDRTVVAALTKGFLEQAYEGLSGRRMDDYCFESDRHFTRAMFLETMARAQEYLVDMHSQHNLSRDDREDKRSR